MNASRVLTVLGATTTNTRCLFQGLHKATNTKIPAGLLRVRDCYLQHSQNAIELEHSVARGVHTSCASYAGHNKWSKIKRKKAVTDQEKSRMRGKLMGQIRAAVVSGGSDPTTNITLAGLLTQARNTGVPKSNIESALTGSGSDGTAREAVMYEGRGPSGYLLLIEAITDNRNRTRPEIRHIIEKQGGVLGEPGSSAFVFDQKAIIEVTTDSTNSPSSPGSSIDPTELAIEVGAEDVEVISDPDTGGKEVVQLKCEPGELNTVCAAVREKGFKISCARVVYLPRLSASLTVGQFEKAEKMVDLLSDQSDVVAVYSNHELA